MSQASKEAVSLHEVQAHARPQFLSHKIYASNWSGYRPHQAVKDKRHKSWRLAHDRLESQQVASLVMLQAAYIYHCRHFR